MSSLVHAALTIRKTARATFGFAAAAALIALVLIGVFRGELGLEHGIVAGILFAIGLARASVRWRAHDDGRETSAREIALLDLELGMMLLAGVHAAVQALGGIAGPLYPLVYVVVAFAAAFARKPMGTVLVVIAVAIESGVWWLAEPWVEPRTVALHVLFVLFFGVLNVLFTRAEIARVRARSRQERQEEQAKARQDLRMFRLVAAPSTEAAGDEGAEERAFRSSVSQVRDQLYHVLELLQRTLELHTCIVLFADGASGGLRIVELVTESDDVGDGPFDAGAGAVGAVASRGLVMNLEHLKPGYKGLCYYRSPSNVRSFLGVPVIEDGHLRGALCADRIDDRPFTARDEEVLRAAVQQVLRAIENERVFVQLERSKREQALLFKASQALGGALTEEHVIDAGLSAAAGIARYDFAAISHYDAERKQHRVLRAVGESAESISGLAFRDNASLTAMVVKNKHALPYRGELDPRQTLYTTKARLPELRSALVLPLVVREDAIGTIALAARRGEAFPDAIRPTLQVLASQIAVSLSNARAVKRLEEMATTDGLTGCLNKRAFLTELESKMRSAERFKRRLSLLVTDIDHFKSVNDTYGHATGDVVIKELAQILLRMKRETDKVARFGGEEFCVLCEETDTDGAILLAERVRDEMQKTVFQTELGKLQVTCSIGVATYPRDAKSASELFEITDKALYAAKRGGRNRVCTSKNV